MPPLGLSWGHPLDDAAGGAGLPSVVVAGANPAGSVAEQGTRINSGILLLFCASNTFKCI